MIRRTQYLTPAERQSLELTCRQTLQRRKKRVKRILGLILGNRFRSSR